MVECGPECEEILKGIEAYLDGESGGAAIEAIELHLSDCHPCMDRTEFRRHLKELVHDRCVESELPPGLADRIRASLGAREAGSPTDA
jgi:mycothiol system anti-sigma-R factor